MRVWARALLFVGLGLLAGCSSGTAPQDWQATIDAARTATVVRTPTAPSGSTPIPTPTRRPTRTPTPTQPPEAPTATPTPADTATPTPPGEPTPTPSRDSFIGCAGLQALLDTYLIRNDLATQALARIQVGLDPICDTLIPEILAEGILEPTPTPTATPIPSFEWITNGDLQTIRSQPALVKLADVTVFAMGGFTVFSTPTQVVDRYDPSSKTWSAAPLMNAARFDAEAILLEDGRVLITGGRVAGNGVLNHAEVFDPELDQWIDLVDRAGAGGRMTQARAGHSMTLLDDGRVLIVGGVIGSGAERTAEIFDPITSTFAAISGTSDARQDHSATKLADGTVIIAGGAGNVQLVERFDPATDSFTTLGILLATHTHHTPVLLDSDNLLVLGGSPQSPPKADLFSVSGGVSTLITVDSVANDARAAFRLPDGRLLLIGSATGHIDTAAIDPDQTINASSIDTTPLALNEAAWIQLGSGEILAVGNDSDATTYRFILDAP